MALDNEFSEEAGIQMLANKWIPAFAGMTTTRLYIIEFFALTGCPRLQNMVKYLILANKLPCDIVGTVKIMKKQRQMIWGIT